MIQGIPTASGLELLRGNLLSHIKRFALVGDASPNNTDLLAQVEDMESTYENIAPHIFHDSLIAVGRFDENGILTYDVDLSNIDSSLYMYAIAILGENNELVALNPTPKVVLGEGIVGVVTLKLPVRGVQNEVIFHNNSDWATRDEVNALRLRELAELEALHAQSQETLERLERESRERIAAFENLQTDTINALRESIANDIRERINNIVTEQLPEVTQNILIKPSRGGDLTDLELQINLL